MIKKDVVNKIANKIINGILKINIKLLNSKPKKTPFNESIKEKIKSCLKTKSTLWITIPDKDPNIRCKLDKIIAIIITEKTFIYIFKIKFFFLKTRDKGIERIKAKISCTSELFNPIKNKAR